MIEYIQYNAKYFDSVQDLILDTITQLNSADYDADMIKIMQDWQSGERLTKKFSEGVYYLAVKNSNVIGVGGLVGTEICTMFVNPLYNGKGIGRKILYLLIKEARKKKLTKISLSSTLTARKIVIKNATNAKMYL